MSPLPEATEAKAEVHYRGETCRDKFTFLSAEMGLPDSLLTAEDIEECGYVKEQRLYGSGTRGRNTTSLRIQSSARCCDHSLLSA
ncbi:hypothetical protein SLE2022_164100 [Rubroshorea leprosula]